MSFWTAIVIIVALVCVAEIIKTRHRASAGITTDIMGNEKLVEREDAVLKREVEELRERVKVLERIATEDRETRRLAAEIDRLREE